jgi:hypothetical protein
MDNNNCIGEVERGGLGAGRGVGREKRERFIPPHPCPVNINITRLGLNRTIVHLSSSCCCLSQRRRRLRSTALSCTFSQPSFLRVIPPCYSIPSQLLYSRNPPNDLRFPTLRVPGSVILQGDNVCARLHAGQRHCLARSSSAPCFATTTTFTFCHCSWQAANPQMKIDEKLTSRIGVV